MYGVSDQNRVADLVEAAREARQQHWWKKEFGDITSDQYLQFVEFEQTAERIPSYEPLFIPGILQTRDYADAITVDLAQTRRPST